MYNWVPLNLDISLHFSRLLWLSATIELNIFMYFFLLQGLKKCSYLINGVSKDSGSLFISFNLVLQKQRVSWGPWSQTQQRYCPSCLIGSGSGGGGPQYCTCFIESQPWAACCWGRGVADTKTFISSPNSSIHPEMWARRRETVKATRCSCCVCTHHFTNTAEYGAEWGRAVFIWSPVSNEHPNNMWRADSEAPRTLLHPWHWWASMCK